MVYKRSLPPPTTRAIRKNQEIISKRNMAVDAGKSAYVRGKYNGLVEVPAGKKGPMAPGKGRIGNDRWKNKPGNPVSKAEGARSRAISTNQGIVSARNMAADAGRSTYVRGKYNGLVDVPRVMVRPKRKPSELDPGFAGPRKYRDGRDRKPLPRPDDGNRKKQIPAVRKRSGSGSTGRMGRGVL